MRATKLRWGVLGTAHIADAQVRAIRMSGNSELSAIASRDLSQAQTWAQERNVPHTFGSYDAMLASDVIDAVYIPLPNALHKEWTIKALQSGKHVLCEKPLASNTSDVEEIIAAAEASGMKAMEAFMYRFHPVMGRLMELLAAGAIGKVKIIRATFGFALNKPDDIRWSAELAGGAIMDVGCYCVNITQMLAGADPLSVGAHAIWAPTGVDETLVGTMQFPGDVIGMVDCSFRTGVTMQQWVIISGTEGRIILPQPFRKGNGPVEIIIEKSDGGDNPGHTEVVQVPETYQNLLMVEHFADAVLNNRPLVYTLQDSLGSMKTIDALKESARAGRVVTL